MHLKIDTGMERIGVHWYSAETLLEASLRCRHLRGRGDLHPPGQRRRRPTSTHARLQLERFAEVLRFYERRSLPTPLRHAANSGAILQLPESHLDLVRPGVLFYGVAPRRRACRAPVPVRAGAALGDPGGVLQGGQAGQPGQLRLGLDRRRADARGHPAGRLRRRLRAGHERQGRGASCTAGATRWSAASAWTR